VGGGIYLVQGDGGLVEMSEQDYASEALLQELLAKYPNLLAGDQIDGGEPRRWLLVSREVPLASEEDGTGRWSVDHLFLDQDAIPTIVEVKRSTDTRIRRRRLNDVPGVDIDQGKIDRRPTIPASALKDVGALVAFLGVLDWFAREVEAT
jgi:hypothetical protein